MLNYRFVNTCINCKHCVDDSVQDGGTYYYCNFDNSFRKEYYDSWYTFDEKILAEKHAYTNTHLVNENGICDNYTENEELF